MMCGIAGYISLKDNPTFSVWSLLERMQQILQHRGPDGKGIFCPNNFVGVAHTRLSILDTTSAGAQPMWNAQKTALITFNGEIYNYKSLKKMLQSLGHTFTTETDTEVLLAAYDQWGINCLDHVEGMFAFMLLNLAKDEVYIARDRIGVKPLFFATDHTSYLACSSEIKALWQIPHLKKEPYVQGISEYLEYLQPLAPHTVYKNIYSLPPAHYIHIDADKKISYHKWYDLLNHAHQISCPEEDDVENWINLLDRTLQDAVEKRLVADVNIGVFLSGGLDSSLIAALMSARQSPVKTFTLHIEGNDVDEREWATKLSQFIGADHHEYVVTKKEYSAALHSAQQSCDQPLGDPLCGGLAILAERIKKQNVSVALFGEGADELFGGYPSYKRYQTLFPWFDAASQLPYPIKNLFKYSLYPISKNRPLLAHALEALIHNEPLFKTSALAMYQPAKLFKKNNHAVDSIDLLQTNFKQLYAQLDDLLPKSDSLTHLAYGELLHRIPQLLLTRFDHMTMVHAVEGRVPFLDHQLVALSLRIPQSLKIKNSEQKWILKKVAEKYLPNDIIYRKKVGFTAPLSKLAQDEQIHTRLKNLLLARNKTLSHVFHMKKVEKWTDPSQPILQTWLLHQLCSLDMFG